MCWSRCILFVVAIVAYLSMVVTQASLVPMKTMVSKANNVSDWCTVIRFDNRFNLSELNLFEDRVMERSAFESARVDKFVGAVFQIGGNWTEPRVCALNICGCDTDKEAGCDCNTYIRPTRSEPVKAPASIFGDHYGVSSLSCACKVTVSTNCNDDTCSSRNDSHAWQGSECGIVYQETQCQSCFFTPITLQNGTHFESLNSYRIVSLLVRPKCQIQRKFYAYGDDFPQIETFMDVAEYVWASYNKYSDNFTCHCQVISPSHPDGQIIWTYIVPACAGIATIFGIIIVTVFIIKRSRSSNLHSPSPETGSQDNLIPASDDDGEEENAPPPPPNEIDRQMKTEIIDVVRNLLRSFLDSLGNDQEGQFAETVKYVDPAIFGGEDDLDHVSEQLSEICNENHILERGSFTIPLESWENPVGKGMFGIVYRGRLRADLNAENVVDQDVAVKKMSCVRNNRDNEVKSFLREVWTFSSIGNGSEFIVEFLGACCYTDGLYILTKFCEGGSLLSHLKVKMATRDLEIGDTYQLLEWCERIASGMEYLSARGIIHVDLAARNILLSENDTIKICDFGLAKKCFDEEICARLLMTGDFPMNSFAPEINQQDIYRPRQISRYVDIWAFSCTLWEIFTLGQSLYPKVTVEDGFQKLLAVRNLLLRIYRHPKPSLASDRVYEMMLECWNEEPNQRPSFTQLREFFMTEKNSIVL